MSCLCKYSYTDSDRGIKHIYWGMFINKV